MIKLPTNQILLSPLLPQRPLRREEVFPKSEVESILLRSTLKLRRDKLLKKSSSSSNSFQLLKVLILTKLTLTTSTEEDLEEKRWSSDTESLSCLELSTP